MKPLQWLYVIYAFLLFFIMMLIVFPFAVITSFFGRINGGNLIYKICSYWADAWLFLIGIYHKTIFESPVNKQSHYIFVSNHISYMDIPQMLKAIRQPMRILGKIEMGKIPVFGFIYSMAVVSVDRSSTEARAKSVKVLKSVLNKQVSIFLCPEGTFNMTDKPLKEFYDGAFRIAIETQTPIKPLLFLDTYDRLHYRSVFTLNPGKLRTVYLQEISSNGYTIKDVNALKQKVFEVMEAKLKEYNASWIKPLTPEGEETHLHQ
ncbi:MAG: 1-acyl-sn-glycerol-3-phosphate acyltransferase [Sphingobacteriales bacterium]|nr:1-acyl-sn-glycerol-3-phosphate acyltransferase [Sphingobacteriales bacterium]